MSESRDEFAVTIKLHNNLLRSRREALGLSPPQLAEKIGVLYSEYIKLENLKMDPFGRKGAWKGTALKVAEFFRVTPEDLFPPEICGVRKSEISLTMSSRDMKALTGGAVGNYTQLLGESAEDLLHMRNMLERLPTAIAQLPEKQAKVIAMRYGIFDGKERTLDEVGEAFGVGRERARQLSVQGEAALRNIFRRDEDPLAAAIEDAIEREENNR